MKKMRILLAEDHETVREGLKMIIDREPDMEIVGEAADGREAVDRALHLDPNVIVMDISMPGLNGLKATRKLKAARPDIQVVALTRHREGGYLQELLQAGASGYVLKQSSSDELIRAIRAVGGLGSPAGSCLWHVVGWEQSLKEWALGQGWNGRRVSQEAASGILIAALGALEAHFGMPRDCDMSIS